VKLRLVIIAALGLALTFYLVVHVGIGDVFSAAIAVGWNGFAILCLYALGLFLILGAAWYCLLPDCPLNNVGIYVWARMVRDAATEVLPFSQLGGIVLGARAAILHAIPQPLVFASMIVDVTTEMLAQIAYVALGAAILIARAPRSDFAVSLSTGLLAGLVLAALTGGVLLALQRNGHWVTAKITSRLLPSAVGASAAVTTALDAIYRSPVRIGVSLGLHVGGWLASAAGGWIAFRLIGARVDFTSVLAIESLVCATRSAGVLIPNALGVQEAAYAVLSPLFGVGADFGLAVSLLKRARDITVGVPILLMWQALEGKRALGRVRT
jgi:glycosyltransferase 2 family protein